LHGKGLLRVFVDKVLQCFAKVKKYNLMENVEYKKFVVKNYTKSELAQCYGIHPTTLIRWMKPIICTLEEIGYTKTAKYLTSKQVEVIIEHLGTP